MSNQSSAKRIVRLSAIMFVMALLLVLLPTHFVAAPELPSTLPRTEDPLQWAAELGLITPDETGSLQPQRAVTRAELASMLTALFDAEIQSSLDDFIDVGHGAWYDAVMAKAVAMGMFRGDNQDKLQPTAQLTRQDAAVLLGRTLGISCGDTMVLQSYADHDAVQTYAAPYLAAMVSSGYLKGTSDKTLSPTAVMTRGQVVQLLYQTVESVCTDRATLDQNISGFVIARNISPTGLRHAGDLLLDVGNTQTLDLRNITVTGRLIVRSSAPLLTVRVDAGVQAGELVFCTPANVRLFSSRNEAVVLLADGSALTGDGVRLYVEGSAVCDGQWSQMEVWGDNVSLSGGDVDQLGIHSGKTMTLTTRVAHADIYAQGYVLGGDGYVDEVWLHGPNMRVDCTVGQSICDYDAGLVGVVLTPRQPLTVQADSPNANVEFTVSGVNSRYVFGVPGGIRSCTATLYRGSQALKTISNFHLKNGAVLSFPVTFSFSRYMEKASDELRVVLRYQDQEVSAHTTVALVNHPDEYYVKQSGVKDPYYIEVVKNHNVVIVYGQDEAGRFTMPVKTFLCSTGKYTPLGSFTTSTKRRWGTLFANYEHTHFCYGQYVTTIYKDYLFHSVPYFTQSPNDLEYEEFNKLGTMASMGCIRLTVADVKWIYDNCPAGTKVAICNYNELPVAKPATPYINPSSPNRGWDPTDPDPSNPWKRPK